MLFQKHAVGLGFFCLGGSAHQHFFGAAVSRCAAGKERDIA